MLAALLGLVWAGVERPSNASTLVHTSTGSLRGLVTGNSRVFRGIPYAEPPLGSQRWREPQPKRPWTGVLDATQMARPCLQPTAGDSWKSIENLGSMHEDCLLLNIVAPAASAAGELLPVMFYIHGG